jgi:hypothetical protein
MIQTGFKSTILKEGYKDRAEKFKSLVKARIDYLKILQSKEPDQKILAQISKETDSIQTLLGFMKISEELIEALEEDFRMVSNKNTVNKKASDYFSSEYEDYFEKYYKSEDELCKLQKTLSTLLTTLAEASNQQLITIRESLQPTT